MDSTSASRRLAPESLIDILYAVVIGTGLFEFQDVLLRPEASFAAFFALASVYVTVAWSWYGYHQSMYQHPYSGLPGHFRLVTDFLILVMYAFLLLSVHEIEATLNPTRYAAVYPAIFLGYMASGLLRRREHGPEASNMGLLVRFFVAFALLGSGIAVWTSIQGSSHEELRSGLAIGGTFLLMGCYRLWRHARQYLRNLWRRVVGK